VSRSHIGRRLSWAFVDDASRLAAVVQVPDEQGVSAARALELAAAEFAAAGIRIERVLTDNGANYLRRAFASVLERLGARHRWTRPYRPQTSGKAEHVSSAPCSTSGPRSALTLQRRAPGGLTPPPQLLQSTSSSHRHSRSRSLGGCQLRPEASHLAVAHEDVPSLLE
jgi:hypothetical protein